MICTTVAGTKKAQFHATHEERLVTWPQEPVPLPLPDFVTAGFVLEDDGSRSFPQRGPVYADGFGELYLKLAALDLDDPGVVLDFRRRYGVLGMHNDRWTWQLWDHNFFGFPEVPAFDDVVGPGLQEHRESLGISGYDETLSEFIWGAQCIKDMTTAWKVVSGQIASEDAEWTAPCWVETFSLSDGPRYMDEPVAAMKAEGWEDAAGWTWHVSPYFALSKGMGAALVPFGPTLHFLSGSGDDRFAGYRGRAAHTISRGMMDEIPLYSVMCLELFNHIAEGATYKLCKNETCVNMFVRQQGTATKGQNWTTGVKYCTNDCARAQAQREYRRRKRNKGDS